MTEQSPLERAARALAELDTERDIGWRYYVPEARAVLMAVREPTKRMIFEGHSYHGPREFDLGLAYTAMIDAALGE